MTDYAEFTAQLLRLTLLHLLAQMPTYRANSDVLVEGARRAGFDPTRDQVRGQLAWLAEQALVTAADLDGRLVVATLTERGLDVAEGRAKQPGVGRPGPKG